MIGFGGSPNSHDVFDVGSSAGGNILTFADYQNSVGKLLFEGNINDNEAEQLTRYWLPYNGHISFSSAALHSWNSFEEPGVPLEYRTLPVQVKNHNIYPNFSDNGNITEDVLRVL